MVSLYIDPATSYYEWKAYHGGATNEWIQNLAVDANGRICGSGWTNSTNLPTTVNAPQKTFGGGQRDILAGCWDANGSLLYSTYLGGKLAELNDNSISFSPTGTLVVTGATNSINLKTTTGTVQPAPLAGNNGLAFHYAATGSIGWGSYLGGIGTDTVGIHNDVEADGSIWMIGNSDSPNFPVTDGSSVSGQDMAVARISGNGATLELGTVVGGSAGDYGIRIAALPDGTAIACGHTLSEDFPATMDAIQTSHGSQLAGANYDLTLTHLDSDGTILAATYLGGAGYDACVFLGVDDAGDVYVNGWTDNLDDLPADQHHLDGRPPQAKCHDRGLPREDRSRLRGDRMGRPHHQRAWHGRARGRPRGPARTRRSRRPRHGKRDSGRDQQLANRLRRRWCVGGIRRLRRGRGHGGQGDRGDRAALTHGWALRYTELDDEFGAADHPLLGSTRASHRRLYKYKLERPYAVVTPIKPPKQLVIGGEWVVLEPEGRLLIRANYTWDGPSGPTIDTPDFMRGSLVHDALYQLMREDLLDRQHRDAADRFLEQVCVEDGMRPLKAARIYFIVKNFGKHRAYRQEEPPLRSAPIRDAPGRGAPGRSAPMR